MKIILGGIPLGCDNVGDEAIVASVVGLIRERLPDAQLTVCTADPGTGPRLSVEVAPPFGFEGVPATGLAGLARGADAFVWCGATGLSDYPAVALDLLDVAQRAGIATFVWGVGMDDELNPAFFKASGRRARVLSALRLTGVYERALRRALRRRVSRTLPRCNGVWVRDAPSAATLAETGFPRAQVAADSAIRMARLGDCNCERAALPSPPGAATTPRVGLCISAQRRVSDLEGVRHFADALREHGAEVVGIPMNPKTDQPLMEGLGIKCVPATAPEDVQREAGKCAVVVSSRLHLLILAANAGSRIIGIERGSKIRNWLAEFGLAPDGTVFSCDWDAVARHTAALLEEPPEKWRRVRAAAYESMFARLNHAADEFAAALKAAR